MALNKELRTPEQQARSKRVHALVMMILGAIMTLCALAAGLIAMRPGHFPRWMMGPVRLPDPIRLNKPALVRFSDFDGEALKRARRENRLVLLHLTPWWSSKSREIEQTTYAEPAVAAWVGVNLVATRADAEQRPDLIARYAIGAWPTTALILPDGRPIAIAAGLSSRLFIPWARQIIEGVASKANGVDLLVEDANKRIRAAQNLPERPLGPEDPVWGGIFYSNDEFAKILRDQTRAIRGRDMALARRTLDFIEKFMMLAEGGYAASTSGDIQLSDGRIKVGAAYFSQDDVRRRLDGLPEMDKRILVKDNRDLAQAITASAAAGARLKAHARKTLSLLSRISRKGEIQGHSVSTNTAVP